MKRKAVVKYVDKDSIAYECGVEPGDIICKINGKEFVDILDFKFLTSDDYYTVEIEKKNGDVEEAEVYNDLYEEFGVEFENQIIDEPKQCRNKCIFCFMDQLPDGMRSTLHFKDDDVRLSFLQGNYVTLTNLDDSEIDRIINLKISPINVSVHTTDGNLRCKMLNNKFAYNIMDRMKKFSDSGILMNAQIVLCPDVNDGVHLEKTIHDLSSLFPNILSVSIVPVGLTKYRDGLYPLHCFDAEGAEKVINDVEKFQDEFLRKYGTRLVYLADEFYILAKREIPPFEYYEDFPQIENGVGLIAAMSREIDDEIPYIEKNNSPKKKSIATGYISYDTIKGFLDKIGAENVNLYKIKNNYFGEKITVTGLLCGCDIIEQLKGKDLGEYLILSESMFKDDCDVFLDDVTLEDVERELGVKVLKTANDGGQFIKNVNL